MAYDKLILGMVTDIPNSPRAALFSLITMAHDLSKEGKVSPSVLEIVRARVKSALRSRTHA